MAHSTKLVRRGLAAVLMLHGCISVGLAADAPNATDSWPQFRGPGARGVSDSATIPERWTATENVLWKSDVPGRGWSSPVVRAGRVFLTTVINREASEMPLKGLYLGGNRPKAPTSVHEWWVYCLDLNTGKELWKEKVHEGPPPGAKHLKNSFASETPVVDDERVYCLFGNLGLYVFDLNGKRLWTKPIEAHAMQDGWGTAASPTLDGDRLYVINDNDEQSYLLSLDVRTGNEVWRVARDEKSNWSTPFVWHNSQRTEIITPGTGRVRSYSIDGKELWSLKGMSSITIATPFAEGDLLFVTSGFIMSRKRPIYAIRPGASGDISLADDQTSSQFVTWCNWRAAPYNPSTLLYRGILYVLLDRGILSAFDAGTGKKFFENERIADGGAFTASPWACNGKVFCINEDGTTFVFKAGEKYELLHSNKLADDDMTLATPAIVGDKLLIRTANRLYCISQGK
jgi:outer membrane protein assembly factor BamB